MSLMIRPRSLQIRLAVAFALLLMAVQAAGLVLINSVLSRSTSREIDQTLLVGKRVFTLLHEENSRQLTQAASILSSDFAFREAAASGNRATVVSALQNQAGRVNADVAMLAGLDNVVIADTLGGDHAGKPFPFARLAAAAQEHGEASGIVVIGGKAYDLVLVPVLAPTPIAWLTMGFLIDDGFAERVQSLTGLDVSFWNVQPDGEWKALASTLPPTVTSGLSAALIRTDLRQNGNVLVRVGGEDYVTAVSTAQTGERQRIATVLQRSLREELAPLRELQSTLLVLGLISLFATIVASIFIARGLTRPISLLSAAAQRIEQGDYSQNLEIAQQDEIGQLASAINHMRDGIAAREAKIGDMAYRDALTGLPNRALFNDRLEQAIRGAKRGEPTPSILLMDLDRFKDVNDTLGHHVGDLLLKEIAARCMATLPRETDTIARLGGDEFAVLLPAADSEGAGVVARRLIAALEQPIILEGQRVSVGASIGIASFPGHGEEMHTLLRHADMAMYGAKRASGGVAVYDLRYDTQTENRLSLMSDLRHAVEHDELVLFYQPKVDLVTGAVEHVEALVRWVHPERGFVPPDQFIPFAEHTGYIKAITQRVITKALAQLVTWHAQGLALHVSVNISARDIVNPDFPSVFMELGKEQEAVLPYLVLEITESGIMADDAQVQGMLKFLRRLGLRLSIDDFGTGYSSLAYLKRLPVQEIKIDKSFVIDMAQSRDDAIIVRSTIDLGHNMGLSVVAEGVENEASWDLLKGWGCDFAQGYHISRPLPPEELEKWLAGRTATPHQEAAAA